ncbi:BTB/POZ protein [Glomus cerebriforme]|uniref:BTB/POZ protein n=1 Tax=Glomus cerebriforme TaxID=658196 RepID=A0A397T976_9GLOM|nr:BTB/POZ protein [Glomus cerebriforme]
MSFEFHSELSEDYLSVFKSEKYSDVIIKVGKESKPKEFQAHSFVLRARSKFFEEEIEKRINNLSRNKIILFIHEDFDLEAFKYILEYLYGGSFDLELKDIGLILNMLIISDFLNLTNLINVIQKYLVEKRKRHLNKQFSIVHQICSKYQSLVELQTYCDKTAQLNPGTIFEADDFINLDKDLLIFILENKKLRLNELQKWDYIIKWGIAQTSSLPLPSDSPSSPSPSTYNTSLWSKSNFRDLSVTLKQIIGLIDCKKIYSKDFNNKIRPFKKIFEKNYYEELLTYHLLK